MFLRKLRVHKDGKEHGYWSLVETVRNHFKKDYDAADVRQSIDAAR